MPSSHSIVTFGMGLLSALLVLSGSSLAQAQVAKRTLTVVGITDFHGALEPEVFVTPKGERVENGGAALLSSYIEILRSKTSGPVLVVDAGDLFQGTMASNLAEGKPVIQFYNSLGVAASALGNHEFDFGPVGENAVPLAPGEDPQGALKERISEASFPFLATNVVDQDGNTPSWLKRSVVVEKGGIRIGIVGAATPETPATTVRANLKGLRFLEPAEPVATEAKRLREQEGVDVVVFTFHGGGACKSNSLKLQDDLTSCQEGEMFSLLRKMPEGLIDVAVGGHTHQGVAKRIGKTAVIQSYSRGKQIGWANVEVGPGSESPLIAGFSSVCGATVSGREGYPSCLPGAVKESKESPKRAVFLGVEVVPDAKTLALIAPALKRVEAIKMAPLGIQALTDMNRSYSSESELGNLVADALLVAVPGAQLAATNGGGLRANIQAGPVRYGHVFEVLPFDNRLAWLEIDGVTLFKMVQIGHGGGHGSLSWAGLSVSATGCTVTDVRVKGEAIDPQAIYKVAINDYLAQGGGGMDSLHLPENVVHVMWESGSIMRDAVARVLQHWGRDLKARDFYSPEAPRFSVQGICSEEH